MFVCDHFPIHLCVFLLYLLQNIESAYFCSQLSLLFLSQYEYYLCFVLVIRLVIKYFIFIIIIFFCSLLNNMFSMQMIYIILLHFLT